MTEIFRAYRYRLCPSDAQASLMAQFAGVTRYVYNLALEQRSGWHRQFKAANGTGISFPSQCRELTALRALQAERDAARRQAGEKHDEANRYVNELVDAKATIAKQAQEIAEMREALRELIGLIGRVMAPGYDNIALQEARSLSNTKGSDDDR